MTIINDSIILLITILHILVVLFVIIAPFSDSNYLLIMHIILIPFIVLHWILNNNTCSLTVAEKYIREISYGIKSDDKDCFVYQFIAPIYDFNKDHEAYSNFIYAITLGLWAISVYNLNAKIMDGKIQTFQQLVKF
jgi:hypothetical protein